MMCILGKVLYRITEILHRVLDEVLARSFYMLIGAMGQGLFSLESYLYEYLKKSKYVASDQFEQKLDENTLILLGMGLRDTQTITLREISRDFGVSEYYARRIKEIARDRNAYLGKYIDIMKSYNGDGEKKDYRSQIRN